MHRTLPILQTDICEVFYTTNTTCTSIVNIALTKLNVKCRKVQLSDGVLLFCTLPNGLTYDLSVCKDGSIRLWRFVGTTSISKAGTRIEYRNPRCPDAAVGFEVTDEGDICLYAENKIDFDNPHSIKSICKLIEGYSSMIINISFKMCP